MKKKYTPSEAELEILQILWEFEPATVRTIHETLTEKKDVGYTTTLKQIQRLFEKGVLSRTSSGKTHLYTTTLKEKEIKTGLIDKLKKTAFNGSALDLVMHALGNNEAKQEEIDMLEKFLEEQKNKKK